jgi:hypothetical protein
MPSAINVTSKDDRPAETSGSGTPVMGRTPITAPMLIAACTTTQAVMAVAPRRQNMSGTRRAIRSPAKASPPYRKVTHNVPTSPSSSPMMAKIKSVVDSGTQPHFPPLAPRPTPNQPPEPTAYLPWMLCMLAPVALPCGSR